MTKDQTWRLFFDKSPTGNPQLYLKHWVYLQFTGSVSLVHGTKLVPTSSHSVVPHSWGEGKVSILNIPPPQKKTFQSTASSFQNRSHYWIEIEGIWYLGQWSSFVINSVNSLPINIPSEMCTSQYFPSLIQQAFLLTWCLSTHGPWQGILKI